MGAEDEGDDRGFHLDSIAELEEQIAALSRQLNRAIAHADGPAVAVEREAICEHTRLLVYHHLGAAVGVTSDTWVWPSGVLDGWMVDRPAPTELSVAGQVWCSLPEGRWREWTEPFLAHFRFFAGDSAVSGYDLCFGRKSTLLDLPTVQAGIASDNPPLPCQPCEVLEWAYLFTKPPAPGAAS